MLTFTGKGKAATCSGVTRRDFLQVGHPGGHRAHPAAIDGRPGRRRRQAGA